MMTIVGEQAERLTHLVETMMLLSRAESNGLPVVREPVYVDDVVEESARALQVSARDRGVEISVSGDTEVMCIGDHQLLRQMVTNLLDNAIRHARLGGSVSATTSGQGTRVAIRISDDGPGVPEHERGRIFERFVRLNADYAGAGLGCRSRSGSLRHTAGARAGIERTRWQCVRRRIARRQRTRRRYVRPISV